MLLQRRICFEKRLSISKILQALRAAPGRIAARADLLVKKIDSLDHTKCHVIDDDLARR